MSNRAWERVTGPDLDQGKAKRADANKSVLGSGNFKSACSAMNIEPTKRQASKWNNGKGLAYTRGRAAAKSA